MPDWRRYVRENLRLSDAFSGREADAVEEIARQMEDAYVDALNLGLSPEEAEREAKLHVTNWDELCRELGRHPIKERKRRMHITSSLDALAREVRYAIRRLYKTPMFTVVSVITLALGIGANTAIFSTINALLLNPVGIANPDRVVAFRLNYEKNNLKNISVSPTDFADIRDSNDTFALAAMAREADFNYNAGDFPERLSGQRVSWQWFDVFGVKPMLGRSFTAEEDQPNANSVVILEYRTWRRLFGGDPSIVGKTIQLNQQPHKIVGVMGPEFRRPNLSVWAPLGLPPAAYGPRNRFNESSEAVARLRPGVSIEQVNAVMRILTERIRQAETYAKDNGWTIVAMPYVTFVVGDMSTPMFVLMGAVGFVLLIACLNIAGLKLARASAQGRELAVRTALGACRWQLVRQTFVESLILVIAGSVTGMGLAYGGVRALIALGPSKLVEGLSIPLDTLVLAFTTIIGIAAAILFGMAPAWQVARKNTHESLKEGGRAGTASRAQLRLRSVLVTLEVSAALVLLIGAGLFVRSLSHLQEIDTGFEPRGLMTAMVELPQSQYREPEKQVAFYRAAVERLSSIPGVTAAATALPVPFYRESTGSFVIEGAVPNPGAPLPHGYRHWISPSYFSALKIAVKRGRTFTDQDTMNSAPVVVIDEDLAERYWPNQDPIGKRLRLAPNAPWLTIAGIVAHVRNSEPAAESGMGAYYLSTYQQPTPGAGLLVKTASEPLQLSKAIREAVSAIDPALPVFELKTMEERITESLGSKRFVVILLAFFAGIALFMAALGLYGLISFSVTQRTHEIGIRMAMGAHRGQVLAFVIGQGMRILLAGLVIGMAGAHTLARILSNQLFQVGAFDPATFALMALLLAAVALLASFIPARRATKVDPLEACRYE